MNKLKEALEAIENMELESSTEVGLSDSNALVSCCFNCINWTGDKLRMASLIKESGDISMDKKEGWPIWGGCKLQHEWLDIVIYGDAKIVCEVPANFCCNWYDADS